MLTSPSHLRFTGIARLPVLEAGFRPLFLAAATWSVAALATSIVVMLGGFDLPSRFDGAAWHIHEMLFGFVMAGVGGFLLTAIPNWTGRRPVSGAPLAMLVALWLIGRAACLVSALLPPWLAVAADLAFPIALEIIAARELLAAGNRRNYPLLAPVVVLAAANLLMHLEALDVAVPLGIGWRLGIFCVLVLITVIGGRIVPAFTRNWLKARGSSETPAETGLVDRVALGVLHASLLAWVFLPDTLVIGAALLAAAGMHFWRLGRWRGVSTTSEPLLLILHVGYLWLPVGSALLGLSVLLPDVPEAAAIHALTSGTFGTMMLAVMTRATLGHTGRPLHADGPTVVIYLLVTVAALLRVAAGWPTDASTVLLQTAAASWIAAFLLFATHYGPMLLGPRMR